ncbi:MULTISPECIES: methylcobamide:CoM methyltransferase MtbA [Sellimonas]|uniref:Methylcobamide--CoM methyltransferase n=1 Tax=Sellimonas caecigallum TaxID=2592333 RepID=A0ABS7L4G8_9FIRM|nr:MULTISPECIES: methylcobamide:CoM methyltransferase MtbA [Sellimonas]MBY0757931.1 methylcobamide--CoM methyltransferase [Sellimonas caecigallum]OUP01167.1 methylcobamide--CoM methyltransferase [Drancourtella sp. An210]OUP65295.1 methylcobamide--CoM methyltransferase [Drancourtella sp. An177]
MLTPKERLHTVLEGNKADRPPCICPGGMMNMITEELMQTVRIYLPEAHTDAQKMAGLAKAVYEQGCFENYGVPFCMTIEAEEMGAKVNLGSRIYEPHVTGYVIDTVSDYGKLPEIDLSKGRVKVVLDAIRILKEEGDVPVVGNLTGPVSTASSVMEPVVFYKEMRKKNQETHAYMEFITNQLIKFGTAQIEAGADVIAISDPSATGEILGPGFFREFTIKYINRLIDIFREKGAQTIVHICGNMNPVYEEVNGIRSDALSFDSVVPMKEARTKLEGRVLMGNVSTYALEFAEPDKVRTLAENCVKNGSDIISPACGLGMKSPLANIRAILQAVAKEEEYASH